ncbi:hypothetical protein B0H16DRAFT_1890334 [Mycena metata]|uniref:F-box domain-containing protein n=1 Tax=Mycena metata TaxID=1033252 RepID=A0AAD7N329_9AGAR|nr:hypothetical protein B0H16DRAFT_1890334 [Mycena metata]
MAAPVAVPNDTALEARNADPVARDVSLISLHVLHMVLLQIYPDQTQEPSGDETQALARLARTCKTFSEPALDTLWSFQGTVFNVFKCMPGDIWTLNWTLRRPILRRDWDRALFYTHRVRYLLCSSHSFPAHTNTSGVFEIVRVALPIAHLFPQLRSLRWLLYPHPEQFLALAPLLFTPTLRRIFLGTFQTMSQLSLLSALAAHCPLLTHIDIDQPLITTVDSSQVISDFVCGLDHIESLEVAYLDQTAHNHIITLPRLKTLTLTTPNLKASTSRVHLPRKIDPRFSALCELTLINTPAESTLAFIASLSNSPLESLTLRNIAPPPMSPFTSLTHISITSKTLPTRAGHLEPPAITIKTLELLFDFTHLTSVELRPPTGIDVTDDDVLLLANAWPHLERLSFRARSRNQPPRATLTSLLYLAEHCPKLLILEMMVDASTVPAIERSVHRARVLQDALVQWTIGRSLIAAPLQVARFLSAIFPELDDINQEAEHSDDEDGNEVDEEAWSMWEDVEMFLPKCRDIREEERFWGRQSYARSRAESLEL